MIHIALVEDDPSAANNLRAILDAYAAEHGVIFQIAQYKDAVAFLTDQERRKGGFDIVFMDIELPSLNGMDAAFKLREMDSQVIIIFVTNMAQYAVRGYEVNALYYILKPIRYQNASQKLTRALALLDANRDAEITLSQSSGLTRLSAHQVLYVEVISHRLIYHAAEQTYSVHGSLSDVEQQLRSRHFYRCNSCYLVNARFIRCINGHTITLTNGEQLQISHPKKKQFMTDITNYLGAGNT